MLVTAEGCSLEAAPGVESMRGLGGGIGAGMDEIDPEAVNDGLDEDDIPASATRALKGGGIEVTAPAWSALGTGAAPSEDLGEDVEKYVKLLADRFIEDYKAVNPN